MNANWKGLLVAMVMILLAGCAPSPMDYADADAIRSESEQKALDAMQSRQQGKERHEVEMDQAQFWAEVRASTLYSTKAMANMLVKSVGCCLIAALCVAILGMGWTVKEMSIGLGTVAVQAAEVRAGLIHMDKSTRTFPAFMDVKQVHGSRYVAMLASGQVLKLDVARPADAMLVMALAQTSAVGAAMQEMRTANNAEGMAMFQPDLIDANVRGLEEG
jgi:hypothetical protein